MSTTPLGGDSARSAEVLLCRCQGRVADAALEAGAAAAGPGVAVADGLCRDMGAGTLARAAGACTDALRIGCTREAPLLADRVGDEVPVRFFPAREYAADGAAAAPRLAALIRMARLPEPPPVESVSYTSAGRLAILGSGPVAMEWAQRLQGKADGQLQVTVFAEDEAPLPAASPRRIPVHRARQVSVQGWLGAFELSWTPANPVDAARCTGCGACLTACTSDAIVRDGVAAYVDLSRCNDKRRCVEVCEAGAIDFSLSPRRACFDLVLDLADTPRLTMAHPPQGYFAPGHDPVAALDAALKLTELVGEFDKPRFYAYDRARCAHSRNRIEGCSRCIDTCSTSAIAADGDGIRVEPHLCMGCGGCASVCPSGAIRYNYPGVPHVGGQLRAALTGWQAAGGGAPTLLIHGREQAAELLAHVETEMLPAGVMPLTLHDAASVGADLLLYALCVGFGRVVHWQGADTPPTYLAAAKRAAGFANAVLEGLGLARERVRLVAVTGDAEVALAACAEPTPPALGAAASFHAQEDKRGTLDLCFRHLAALAPQAAQSGPLPLPAGSPYGGLAIAKDKCTLCQACIGACPTRALSDDREAPRLRFAEASCVQCGLCVSTCPEDALALMPRLDLRPEAKRAVVLNEDQPFHCVRCSKPFGSSATIRSMTMRLAGHALFATEAQKKRLSMCGDCRVIDMIESGEGRAPHATALDL